MTILTSTIIYIILLLNSKITRRDRNILNDFKLCIDLNLLNFPVCGQNIVTGQIFIINLMLEGP